MQTAPPGQKNFKIAHGLVAGVAQVIFGVDVNGRGRRIEANVDFLLLDDVPGAERGRARREPESTSCEEQRKRESGVDA